MKLSKRRKSIAKRADNEFTAHTGIQVIKLTGKNSNNCWISTQTEWNGVPVKKVSYLIHDPSIMNAWIQRGHQTLKTHVVKGTCGINECVNPAHLAAEKVHYNPWA